MSMLSRVQDTALKPPRIVIHGRGGVGKTSFGASSKAPILIPFEDGAGAMKMKAFPKPSDYAETLDALEDLRKLDHPYNTLVADTIDHFEPLVWAEVCRKQTAETKKKYENIEDFGYGKGYLYADPLWVEFFQGLDALRRDRGMTVIILSHCESKTVEDSMIGAYDRVTPKLHKRANALLHEWSDVCGYLDIEKTLIDKENGRKKMTTAVVTGRRMLYLEDRGGFVAKNRYDLPPQIEIPKEEPFSALRNAIMQRVSARETK